MENKSEPIYKYNLLKKLKRFPAGDFKKVMNTLPVALHVSKSTLKRWVYKKKGEPGQIPLDALTSLAAFFHCPVDDLINEEAKIINYEDLIELEKDELKNKYNLKQ